MYSSASMTTCLASAAGQRSGKEGGAEFRLSQRHRKTALRTVLMPHRVHTGRRSDAEQRAHRAA
jgi:hypothetical protein